MNFNEPVYTTEEVAKRYRVAACTVQNWVRQGRMTAINLGGQRSGPYVFRLADLVEFEMSSAVGKAAKQAERGAGA